MLITLDAEQTQKGIDAYRFSRLLTVKGAPDVLLGRCSSILRADGRVEPLSEQTGIAIGQLKDKWSSDGRRVILLARKTLSLGNMTSKEMSPEMQESISEEISSGLVFVGLLALIDEPRPEIPDVMSTLRGAGIRTFMVCPRTRRTSLNSWNACS